MIEIILVSVLHVRTTVTKSEFSNIADSHRLVIVSLPLTTHSRVWYLRRDRTVN